MAAVGPALLSPALAASPHRSCPVTGWGSDLWEAQGVALPGWGQTWLAPMHPPSRGLSREGAELVKIGGMWCDVDYAPAPCPQQRACHLPAVLQAAGSSGDMEPRPPSASCCAPPQQRARELAQELKEVGEQSGWRSDHVTHKEVSRSVSPSPNGSIWIEDLEGSLWR